MKPARLFASAAVLAIACPAQVIAQTAPRADTDASDTGEIIVTAQKRAQALDDVGLTIAAVTSQQLQALGVTDIGSLGKAVSGLVISSDREGLPVFSVRGIGFVSAQLAAAPTVSIYVDEAPLPYPSMAGNVTLDLERVEVLKGPQGTLFGNNSTGGSINFIAAKPTTELAAGIRASIDRFGQFFTEGYVSGPLSDTLRVRVAGSTTQGGDWQRTYTPGPKLENGKADKFAVRLLTDWEPVETLKISLNLNHYTDQSDPVALQFAMAAPSGGPGSAYVDPVFGSVETYPLPPHSNRAADFSQNPTRKFRRNDNFNQAVLRGDLNLSDTLKLTSITNYSRLKMYLNRDSDATRIDVIEGGHTGRIRTYGTELRLAGDFHDIGLNVIVGGNLSNDKVHEEEPYLYPHFSILAPGMTTNPVGDFTSKTTAAFASADWEITKQLTLTAGIRYTQVKQTYSDCFLDPGNGSTAGFVEGLANIFRGAFSGLGPLPAGTYPVAGCNTIGAGPEFKPTSYSDRSTDHNVAWRAGLNFKPVDDLLLYGLVSRGFKAGGYPFIVPITIGQLNKVNQEKITAYELGIKYSAGRVFNISAAGFYYDYTNKQTYALSPVPALGPASVLRNIPKSKAYGLEAEARLSPVEPLNLHAAITYTKTKITDPGGLNLDGFGQPIDLRGKPFAYAPKLSVIFDAEYRVPVSSAVEAFVGVNGTYASTSYSAIDATAPFKIKSYTTLDARIGVDSRAGWTASVWIRNLTNEYYWTDVNFIGDGFAKTPGLPRNFGLTLGYRF